MRIGSVEGLQVLYQLGKGLGGEGWVDARGGHPGAHGGPLQWIKLCNAVAIVSYVLHEVCKGKRGGSGIWCGGGVDASDGGVWLGGTRASAWRGVYSVVLRSNGI